MKTGVKVLALTVSHLAVFSISAACFAGYLIQYGLGGEHRNSVDDSPHIAAASITYRRFRNTNCEPEQMRQLAAKLAAQRQH